MSSSAWYRMNPKQRQGLHVVCACFCMYVFLLSLSCCCYGSSIRLDNNVANSCFDLTAFRCHLFPSTLPRALSPLLSLTRDKSKIYPFSLCCGCLLEKKRAERERRVIPFSWSGTQLSFIFKDCNKICCCPAVNLLLFFVAFIAVLVEG